MPAVTWHGQDGVSKVEEGAVSILARFLFVNGTKRRKLVDLGGAPERGDEGQVILRFGKDDWCGVSFEKMHLADQFQRDVLGATGKAGGAGRASSGPASGGGSVELKGGRDAALPAGWDVCVRAAVKKVFTNEQTFWNPLPMDTDKLSDAASLLRDVCAAWEESDTRRRGSDARINGDGRRDAEIAVTHLRAAEVRALAAENENVRLLKSSQFIESEVLLLRSQVAESERALKRADPGGLLERNRFLENEVKLLRERLIEVNSNPSAAKKKRPAPAQQQQQQVPADIPQQIAELEVGPLRDCPVDERDALKRKLLLKWHPDKQPSVAHAEIAKRVMQELQNAQGWCT